MPSLREAGAVAFNLKEDCPRTIIASV